MSRRQNIWLLVALIGFIVIGLAILFLGQAPERGWVLLPMITSLPALVITLEHLLVKPTRRVDLIEEIESWLSLQRRLTNPDQGKS
jgi:uncharacterized membrane protein